MTTDNRTNEPTEAQIEAAAKAIREVDARAALIADVDLAEYRARAALVAAQEAAPQTPKDIHEPNHDRAYCVRCGGNWPCQPAPVPSSGVDEDALAEVIAKSRGFGNGWEQIPPLTREAYREIARAVAEWLKGQGGESRAQDSA